jgi:hypothetical protein
VIALYNNSARRKTVARTRWRDDRFWNSSAANVQIRQERRGITFLNELGVRTRISALVQTPRHQTTLKADTDFCGNSTKL